MEAIVMEALGEEGFARLVEVFYQKVRTDTVIGPQYPEKDWDGAEKRLRDFLIFRFGGSDRYIQERGHPRLRMRHVPFAIGEAERDRWLELMFRAMDDIEFTGEARELFEQFLSEVADFLRNREG